jgi:Stage II sporulation protein
MKVSTFLLLISVAAAPLSAASPHWTRQTHVQKALFGPRIHILLEKSVDSAIVEAKGGYKVIRKDTGKTLSSGTIGKKFTMQAIQHGLRWGEEYPDVYEIAIVPTKCDTTISVNGIQYKGAVSFYHVRDLQIAIVNEVSIEEYLKSTLAAQYAENDLSEEALAALAIIARTEAYAKTLARSRPWDVTVREAEYFGLGHDQNIEAAVNGTKYLVLETKDKALLQNPHLSSTKANELAQRGMDAQKILKSVFPAAKIGATITPTDLTIR